MIIIKWILVTEVIIFLIMQRICRKNTYKNELKEDLDS